MKEIKEYNLKIGETAEIKKGILSKYSVVYAGKLNSSLFSLVVTWTSGYNSMAYNLYLPTTQTKLKISRWVLDIQSVSSENLIFRFAK